MIARLRRRSRICIREVRHWERCFDGLAYPHVVYVIREGDVVPAKHPLVRRYRRHFRRGPR